MADLKKKFIDILFEDDEKEVMDDTQEVIQETKIEQVEKLDKQETQETSESVLNARDVLYRKPASSTFINLVEPISTDMVTDVNKDENYEFTSQISPMFGVVKPNKKKPAPVAPEITECQTSKPIDSHLDIITSPIYGYGNKEDAMLNNYDVKGIDETSEDEEELHELFDDSFKEVQEDENELSLDDLDDVSLFRLFGDSK